MAKEKEVSDDIYCLVPLSNVLVDLLKDERISHEIRADYANKLQKVASWIPLLSMDYIEEKYGKVNFSRREK